MGLWLYNHRSPHGNPEGISPPGPGGVEPQVHSQDPMEQSSVLLQITKLPPGPTLRDPEMERKASCPAFLCLLSEKSKDHYFRSSSYWSFVTLRDNFCHF